MSTLKIPFLLSRVCDVLYYKNGRELLRFSSISLTETIAIGHWSHFPWVTTITHFWINAISSFLTLNGTMDI